MAIVYRQSVQFAVFVRGLEDWLSQWDAACGGQKVELASTSVQSAVSFEKKQKKNTGGRAGDERGKPRLLRGVGFGVNAA